MPAKKPSNADLAWRAAQAALEAARQLPAGVERFEALKKAGKLRFDADIERAREIDPVKSNVCPNDQRLSRSAWDIQNDRRSRVSAAAKFGGETLCRKNRGRPPLQGEIFHACFGPLTG